MPKRGSTKGALGRLLQQHEVDARLELDAELTPVAAPKAIDTITEIPITAVAPNRANPRKDLGDLDDLVASITSHGILQPITVRPVDAGEAEFYPDGTRYILLMGERRWAASQIAGRDTVPVVVRRDLLEVERQVMLIENLQRSALSPVEEARAFAELIDMGLSQREIARQLHLTQPHVSRRLSLLELHPELLALVSAGRIGVDVAYGELSRLPLEQQQFVAARLTTTDAAPIDLTPDIVRQQVALAKAQTSQLRRVAEQRRWLEEGGLVVYAERRDLIADADRRDMDAVYVGTASEVDDTTDMVGVLNPLQAEADLYRFQARTPMRRHATVEDDDIEEDDARLDDMGDTDAEDEEPESSDDTTSGDTAGITPASDTAGITPAGDTAGITPAGDTAGITEQGSPRGVVARDDLSPQERNRLLDQGIEAWIDAHPKAPAKSLLAQELAEYVVATAGRDAIWRVCRWLSPRGIGCEVDGINDWATWAASITPQEAPLVAWLVLVASDLHSARNGGSGLQPTRERIAEVAPHLVAQLGLDEEGAR